MHENMAVYLTVEDPEDLGATEAYCVLTEVHMNYRTQTLVVAFECWRNQAAYEANRKPFTAIQFQFDPDKGGEQFYRQHGIDGVDGKLGHRIREFCMTQTTTFKHAHRAENVKTVAPDIKVEEAVHHDRASDPL